MIPGIAEYVDVDPQHELLLDLYEKVKGARAGEDFNVFGKTPFESYSLEFNMTGEDLRATKPYTILSYLSTERYIRTISLDQLDLTLLIVQRKMCFLTLI